MDLPPSAARPVPRTRTRHRGPLRQPGPATPRRPAGRTPLRRHGAPAAYGRWAASVPAGFRFAVKVPREITHRRRLADVAELLDRFLAEAGALGDRLGPLLVQLPPRLPFDADVVKAFFIGLRRRFRG